MKYVDTVNDALKSSLMATTDVVVYGQNINAGSCLSGLTKGISLVNKGPTLNTQNSENMLVGMGFGLMLNGISSIYFMKQLDFLLLSMDHLVNTYNIIRERSPSASFTIFPITVDSGFEGPQSRLNNVDDFCSISGVEAYSFTNREDTASIISRYLVQPGFRILSTGQRLLKQDTLDLGVLGSSDGSEQFKYRDGRDCTIVCFNHSLPYGLGIWNAIDRLHKTSSLFSVNAHHNFDYASILDEVKTSARLIVVDDSKSRNRLSEKFLLEASNALPAVRKVTLFNEEGANTYAPADDSLNISYEEVALSMFSADK